MTAFVGCGMPSQSHSSGYRRSKNFFLHGVVSSENPKLADEWGIISYYPSLEAILNAPMVGAIDLAVLSYIHDYMALVAVRHSEHIILEKQVDIRRKE